MGYSYSLIVALKYIMSNHLALKQKDRTSQYIVGKPRYYNESL